MYGSSCKGVHIYTGKTAHIESREVVDYFYDKYCQPFSGDETYLKVILGNIFSICGYKDFINYFKRDPNVGSKISLQKVIKKIQQKFSEEEWTFLKKYHKSNKTGSRKSSTLSHKSIEEEKFHRQSSDTSSIASGKFSNSSSHRAKHKQAERLAKKFQRKDTLEILEELDEEMNHQSEELEVATRKSVHVDQGGHIELRDLKEKDFHDLIEAKNQDKRFYGWLHFMPIFDDEDEEIHYKVDPQQDIEYFKQLYDNNLFTSFDSEQVPEKEIEQVRDRNFSL